MSLAAQLRTAWMGIILSVLMGLSSQVAAQAGFAVPLDWTPDTAKAHQILLLVVNGPPFKPQAAQIIGPWNNSTNFPVRYGGKEVRLLSLPELIALLGQYNWELFQSYATVDNDYYNRNKLATNLTIYVEQHHYYYFRAAQQPNTP